MYKSEYVSPLGLIRLTADDCGLRGVYFESQSFRFAGEPQQGQSAVLDAAERWLDAYFAGERPSPSLLPLAPEGSVFRRRVWEMLLEIPYGETLSYGEIAARIAAERGMERMSAQAVGTAVGHNPISIIIPCHRVLAAGKAIGGYNGGTALKMWLLRHEGAEFKI